MEGNIPEPILTVTNAGGGPGLRGVSNGNDGIKGVSTGRGQSGVYGHGETGPGVSGRSEQDTGVVGWSGAGQDESGVYGHSEHAVGVKGRSDHNNGVVGWTGGEGSGVYGLSDVGIGVTGRSGGNDGLLGVTTSSNPGHAGLHARNEGAGPAIFCEGDLFVTGTINGDVGPNGGGPFPKPAYVSQWETIPMTNIPIGMDANKILYHNLGGNPDNYVVDLQIKGEGMGLHHKYYGSYFLSAARREDYVSPGAYWTSLNDQSITVWKGWSAGDRVKEVRVRIWAYE
jgi:hypothetical protein